jgi:hypothetical protein
MLVQEVGLADQLVQDSRTHPGSEGLAICGWPEERVRPGARRPLRGHARSLRGIEWRAGLGHRARATRSSQIRIRPATLMASASAMRIASIRPAVRLILRTSLAT